MVFRELEEMAEGVPEDEALLWCLWKWLYMPRFYHCLQVIRWHRLQQIKVTLFHTAPHHGQEVIAHVV